MARMLSVLCALGAALFGFSAAVKLVFDLNSAASIARSAAIAATWAGAWLFLRLRRRQREPHRDAQN